MKHKKRIFSLAALVLLVCILLGLAFQRPIKKTLYPQKFDTIVERYATLYDLSPHLVYAVIKAESGFDPNVLSPAGAVGLMQIMPSTFLWLTDLTGEVIHSDQLTDPEVNIRYGCYFLRYLLDIYEDQTLALATYNAGMGNVAKWLASPEYSENGKLTEIPFEETKNYISRVTRYKEAYEALYPKKGTRYE